MIIELPVQHAQYLFGLVSDHNRSFVKSILPYALSISVSIVSKHMHSTKRQVV